MTRAEKTPYIGTLVSGKSGWEITRTINRVDVNRKKEKCVDKKKIEGTKNACNKNKQTKICVNEKLPRRKNLYTKKGRDENIRGQKIKQTNRGVADGGSGVS